MQQEIEWIKEHRALSAMIVLASLIAGGFAALFVWDLSIASVDELRAAEEQMVTSTGPGGLIAVVVISLGLAVLAGLLVGVPRRWTADGD